MAKKDKTNFIGDDPLLCMGENSEEVEAKVVTDNKHIVEQANTVENQEGSMIILQTTVNIQTVSVLHEQLKNALDKNERIEIDASAVTLIDTSTLQLFAILKQTALQMNKIMMFEFPSEQFVEEAKICGLAEFLDIDQAAAGLF
ncbi:MAG: STAS domain-containing protein [Methylococcales bacterium]|nr:STAS domain-containing protein [Methylococcales bacterium]